MLGALDLRLKGYYKMKQGIWNKFSVNNIDLNQQVSYVINLINL